MMSNPEVSPPAREDQMFSLWNFVDEIREVSPKGEVTFSGKGVVWEYIESISQVVSHPKKNFSFLVSNISSLQAVPKDRLVGTYLILESSQVLYGSFIIDTPNRRFQRFYGSYGYSKTIWLISSEF